MDAMAAVKSQLRPGMLAPFAFTTKGQAQPKASVSTSSSGHKTPARASRPRQPAAVATSPFSAETSREDKIAAGRVRLTERLRSETLRETAMEDDGNCQFRALSSECYGTQRWHRAIRLRVVAHIASQKAEFAPFFPGAGAFEGYLAEMRLPGTWGDELTLRAAADLLQAKVFVITSEEENWFLHYDPQLTQTSVSETRCLFITYISPIHYNTIEHDPAAMIEQVVSAKPPASVPPRSALL